MYWYRRVSQKLYTHFFSKNMYMRISLPVSCTFLNIFFCTYEYIFFLIFYPNIFLCFFHINKNIAYSQILHSFVKYFLCFILTCNFNFCNIKLCILSIKLYFFFVFFLIDTILFIV